MFAKTRFAASAALFVLVLFAAACAPTGEPVATETAPAGQLYGTELTLASATPIGDLLAEPEPLVGKIVQIKGTAVHVCKHSGKRLRLMDPETESAIMVDFAEVGLEFPAETLNHTIVAEGTLLRRDLGPAPKEEAHEHAEGEGHDEDAAPAAGEGESCAAEEADADETRHVYVIAGLGARDLDL